MLDTLEYHHGEVLRCLDALEALMSDLEPRLPAVTAARLALTRASRARTLYLETAVYPVLLANGRISAVTELRDAGRAQQAHSAEHIGRWTAREIELCWGDYKKASNSVRRWMKERISLEKEVIGLLLAESNAS